MPESAASSDNDSESQQDHLTITPDSFVIVQIIPQGKKKVSPVHYVGNVICAEKGGFWCILFMRRHGCELNQFIFPEKEDTELYCIDEIVKVLCTPKVLRNNVHNFPDDLSFYRTTLR
jgi:hypothetical protein